MHSGTIDTLLDITLALTSERFETGIRFATPYRETKICFNTVKSKVQSLNDNSMYFLLPFSRATWQAG